MKKFLIIYGLFLVGQIEASEPVPHRRPPSDAGISDEELSGLGNGADAELIKRLASSENAKYRKGILLRMRLYGKLERPNREVFEALKQFVESEVVSCTGQVPMERIFNIDSALEVAGQRGGSLAVEYLAKWVTDSSVFGRVKCFYRAGTPEDVQEHFRRYALEGLGMSGEKQAIEFLLAIAKNRPKVKYPGNFDGALNNAISKYAEIEKGGIENYYREERENIKAHSKAKEKRQK